VRTSAGGRWPPSSEQGGWRPPANRRCGFPANRRCGSCNRKVRPLPQAGIADRPDREDAYPPALSLQEGGTARRNGRVVASTLRSEVHPSGNLARRDGVCMSAGGRGRAQTIYVSRRGDDKHSGKLPVLGPPEGPKGRCKRSRGQPQLPAGKPNRIVIKRR